MKKIGVFIDWNQNFGAVSDLVPGCVATGKTFEEVKENYFSALEFHLEGLEEKEIPKELKGNYELEFEFTVQALLHRFDKILTRAALSRITGINERQLGHYVSGYRSPRAAQKKKIVDGFHKLGKEFLSVVVFSDGILEMLGIKKAVSYRLWKRLFLLGLVEYQLHER